MTISRHFKHNHIGWDGGMSQAEFAAQTHSGVRAAIMIKKKDEQMLIFFLGWDGGIRTPECRHQKPMPYHLATSH
jgi:hypothetical protein